MVASDAMAAAEISASRNVLAAVVAPDVCVLMNTRSVVATPVVGVVATERNRILRRKLPSAPAVKTLKISVPIVPPPAEDVFAADCVMVTLPIFGVRVQMGVVFAAINASVKVVNLGDCDDCAQTR